MNSGGASGEGAASILRAVGSLLVALSGADQSQVDRTLGAMQAASVAPAAPETPSTPTARPAVTSARSSYPQPLGRPAGAPRTPLAGATGDPDDVEFVLEDARQRAQGIIEESMERARALLDARSNAGGAIDARAFDDLRRGLRGLVTEVRDVQQRLGRIEQLLRAQSEHDAPPVYRARTAQPAYDDTPEALVEEEEWEPDAPASPAPPPAPYAESRYYGASPYREVEEPWYEDEPELVEGGATAPAYSDEAYADETYDDQSYEDASDDSAHDEATQEEYAPEAYTEPAPDLGAAIPPSPPRADYDLEPAEPEFDDTAPTSPTSPTAPPAAPPSPPRSSFSVVPPQRREWTPVADAGSAAAAAQPLEPPVEPAAAWSDDDEAYDEAGAGGDTGAPLVTFLPSDGSITLRVTPVAGFQGLMRIQDALTRLPAVRHASVEAYSQGEARLRIELADTSDSDELAEGLARGLRGPARVEAASEADRDLLISLR